jgi:hypothetical protein
MPPAIHVGSISVDPVAADRMHASSLGRGRENLPEWPSLRLPCRPQSSFLDPRQTRQSHGLDQALGLREKRSDNPSMPVHFGRTRWLPFAILALVAGCTQPAAQAPETFSWCPQPISFSPPPSRWWRQGDGGGGTVGVRFILSGGGGQCISVAAYNSFVERDRRAALARLIARRDSLEQREFLHELSLARARTDDPLSEREAAAAMAINAALDRAASDYLEEQPGFVRGDLEDALRAASGYQMTLAEALPRIRLRPERMQEPDRWRLGYERDTVIAGRPAFASDDTLITPERPLLYQQVYWVVNGCAFQAIYQGTPENLSTFRGVLDSIDFPQDSTASPR